MASRTKRTLTRPAAVAGPKTEKEELTSLSGLQFLPAAAERMGATDPRSTKQCWGQLLHDPQFVGLPEFRDAVDELEDIVEAPIAYLAHGDWVKTNHKALLGKRSGKLFSVATDKYVAVQDAEVARPFIKAAQERGLHPIGRIDGQGTGRTRGHIILANPEFRIRLLEDYADDVLLGVRFWNSSTGDTSFGAEMFGVRTVCTNYALWGRLLGEFRLTHRIQEAAMMDRFNRMLTHALDASPKLSDLVIKARNLVVVERDVPDLLWGIALPVKGIKAIQDDMSAYCPEVKTLGLNAWTLYNSATAFISYRANGGKHLSATEEKTRLAMDLLTGSHDRLIEKGRENKKRYDEMLRLEREKAKARRAEQKDVLKVAAQTRRGRKVT